MMKDELQEMLDKSLAGRWADPAGLVRTPWTQTVLPPLQGKLVAPPDVLYLVAVETLGPDQAHRDDDTGQWVMCIHPLHRYSVWWQRNG